MFSKIRVVKCSEFIRVDNTWSLGQLTEESDAPHGPVVGRSVDGHGNGDHEVGGMSGGGQRAPPLSRLVHRTQVYGDGLRRGPDRWQQVDQRHGAEQLFRFRFFQHGLPVAPPGSIQV